MFLIFHCQSLTGAVRSPELRSSDDLTLEDVCHVCTAQADKLTLTGIKKNTAPRH